MRRRIVVVAIGLIAIARRAEPYDERDRLIRWRAESKASWVLVDGIFLAVFGLIFSIGNVWTMQILVLSLFLSEVTKFAFQLLYYRRGV